MEQPLGGWPLGEGEAEASSSPMAEERRDHRSLFRIIALKHYSNDTTSRLDGIAMMVDK